MYKIRECSVPGCQRQKTKNINLHSLPDNKVIRSIWMNVLRINKYKNTVKVCSRHFHSSDYSTTGYKKKIKRLKKGAIPSQYLPSVTAVDKSTIETNLEQLTEQESQLEQQKVQALVFNYDEHAYSRGNRDSVGTKVKRKYPKMCSVPGCGETKKCGVALHQFPKDIKKAIIWKNNLNIRKQTKYLVACSKHFKSQDFFQTVSTLTKDKSRLCLKKNAVPMSAKEKRQKSPDIEMQQIYTNMDEDMEAEQSVSYNNSNVFSNINESPNVSTDRNEFTDVFTNHTNVSSQFDEVKCYNSNEYTFQHTTNERGTHDVGIQCNMYEINLGREDISDLIRSDKELNCWTNIQSYDILRSITKCVEFVCPKKERKHIQIDLEHLILMVFIKFKLNLPFVCIATLFRKKAKSVSNYIYYIIPYLKAALEPALYWPSREEIRSNLPKHFQNFRSTRVVLDCFEIKIPKLKCLTCRILTYSNYKKGQTIKFLLGVTPSGHISYISAAYSGRSSDKLIFNNENFLGNHEFDAYIDSIMVDKGFYIEDECNTAGIKLIRPPFLRKKLQLSPEDAELNVNIAKARVHVERVIQRIRLYDILTDKVEQHILPWIDDITHIICCVVNLCSPVLADERF